MPEAASDLECRRIFRANDRAFRLAVNDGVRCVMERAQHPGHVAQRATLDAALAERPRRLAFEVDDDEVVAGEKDLAEVIVAVDADAEASDAPVDHFSKVLVNFRFA